MNARDPRVDPQKGDVLRHKDGGLMVHVRGADTNAVSWYSLGMPGAASDITEWREWAKVEADVIHTAKEQGE